MRKTFLLGGSPFTAPDPIGSGIRARVLQFVSQLSAEKGLSKNTESKQLAKEYPYDFTIGLFKILLTGEHPIVEAYDSATDEEVAAIMIFFTENLSGKTLSEPTKTNSSPRSKKTPKVKA